MFGLVMTVSRGTITLLNNTFFLFRQWLLIFILEDSDLSSILFFSRGPIFYSPFLIFLLKVIYF